MARPGFYTQQDSLPGQPNLHSPATTGSLIPQGGAATTLSHVQGPLPTQAKSRDHEFVRAQKKVSKGPRPDTPPKSCSVVTDPQVLCGVICARALNQMLFQ